MSGWIRRVPVIVAIVLQITGSVVAQAPPRDLRNVFAAGYILQDRNQDDVIDFVRARIALPARPSAAELAAAANIASRLGYETAALDPGLATVSGQQPATFDVPVIVIGNPPWLGSDALARRTDLGPGQGALVFLPTERVAARRRLAAGCQ